jgi:beta-N-acetylhexosaminidase
VRRLAAWTTRTQTAAGARAVADAAGMTAAEPAVLGAPAGGAAGSAVGQAAARRAVKVTVAADAATLPVTGPPHVVEFAPPRNIAIGAETPWGVGAPLDELLPGTTALRLTEDDLAGVPDPAAPALAGAAGRPLVLVVRDVHRHSWLAEAMTRLLAARPDAIVVEMGVPVTALGGVHIATFGATRANGLAAAELIAGTRVPAPRPQPLAA